ncbi:hypothetical protein Q0Z83_027700 [Actinoplanes sichuanensis]|nr:hypothetical protein Q0Z83_027700 [Actinoplanes sichuanensis]
MQQVAQKQEDEADDKHFFLRPSAGRSRRPPPYPLSRASNPDHRLSGPGRSSSSAGGEDGAGVTTAHGKPVRDRIPETITSSGEVEQAAERTRTARRALAARTGLSWMIGRRLC